MMITHLSRDQSETVAGTFYDHPAENMRGFVCVSDKFNIENNTYLHNSGRKCHGEQLIGK
jgi:hypothetical protein